VPRQGSAAWLPQMPVYLKFLRTATGRGSLWRGITTRSARARGVPSRLTGWKGKRIVTLYSSPRFHDASSHLRARRQSQGEFPPADRGERGDGICLYRKRAKRRPGLPADMGAAAHWATVGGAAALGLEDKIGTIRAGKKADLVLIKNDGSPALFPIVHPYGNPGFPGRTRRCG
jgi:hypothetical protein